MVEFLEARRVLSGVQAVSTANPNVVSTSSGKLLNVVWIDSAASSSGNGTFAHPYNILPSSVANADLILVRAGTVYGNITLAPNQVILGEGGGSLTTSLWGTVNLPSSFNINSSVEPTLQGVISSRSTITLSSNNVIQGLNVKSAPAVSTAQTTAATPSGATAAALAPAAASYSDQGGPVVIKNVNFTGAAGGVALYVSNLTHASLDLTISNVTTSGGLIGTEILAAAPVKVAIDKLTVDNSTGTGLYLVAQGSTLTGAVTNSTIKNTAGLNNLGISVSATGGGTINATFQNDTAAGRTNLFAVNAVSSTVNVTGIGLGLTGSTQGNGIALNYQNSSGNVLFQQLNDQNNTLDGLGIIETGTGNLSVTVQNSTIANDKGNGVNPSVTGAGHLNLVVSSTIVNHNLGAGLLYNVVGAGSQMTASVYGTSTTYNDFSNNTNGAFSGTLSGGATATVDLAYINGKFSGKNGYSVAVDGVGTTFKGTVAIADFSNSIGSGIVLGATNGASNTFGMTSVTANNDGTSGLVLNSSSTTNAASNLVVTANSSTFNSNGFQNIAGIVSGALSKENVQLNAVTANGLASNAGAAFQAAKTGQLTLNWAEGSIMNNKGNGLALSVTDPGSVLNANLAAASSFSITNNVSNGISSIVNAGSTSALNLSLNHALVSNNAVDGVMLSATGPSTTSTFNFQNTTINQNGSTGLDVFQNGANAVQNLYFTNGSLSNNHGNGVSLAATAAGAQDLFGFFNVNVNSNGMSGLNLNSTGAKNNLGVNLFSSTVTSNTGDGVVVNINGTNATAPVTFNKTPISSNGRDGYQFSSKGGANLQTNGTNGTYNLNKRDAINGMVDGVGSQATVDVSGSKADQSGAQGALLTAQNSGSLNFYFLGGEMRQSAQQNLFGTANSGGTLGITASGTLFNNGGLLGNSSNVRVDVNGANSLANATFVGVNADSSTKHGFEFNVSNTGSLNAQLNTTAAAGVLSASSNLSGAGISITGNTANSVQVAMSGANLFNSNGAQGAVDNLNGANSALFSFSGSANSNGSNGIEVDYTSVLKGQISTVGAGSANFNKGGGSGLLINLNNSTLASLGGGSLPINLSGFTYQQNAGNGLLLNVNGSSTIASTALISGNTFLNNADNGLHVTMPQGNAATMNGLIVDSNTATGNFNSGLLFDANGGTFKGSLAITNSKDVSGNGQGGNGQPGIAALFANTAGTPSVNVSNNAKVASNFGGGILVNTFNAPTKNVTIDGNTTTANLGGDGIVFRDTNSATQVVDVSKNTSTGNAGNAINVNMQSSNNTGVTISNNTASTNTLAGILYTANSSLSTGALSIDSNTVKGNLNGGGILANLSNSGAASLSASSNTVDTNNGPALQVIATGSPLTNALAINSNTVNNSTAIGNPNNGYGILFQTDSSVGGPASVSNNTVSNSANSGIAFIEQNSPFNLITTSSLNFDNNNISNSKAGDGLAIQLTSSPSGSLSISNNTLATSTGNGISFATDQALSGAVAVNNNTVSGSTLAGITFQENAPVGNAIVTASLNFDNNKVTGSLGGNGLLVLINNAGAGSLSVSNGTYGGNTAALGNAGDGVDLHLSNSNVTGAVAVNNNTVGNNLGTGAGIYTVFSSSNLGSFSGSSNTISTNAGAGLIFQTDTQVLGDVHMDLNTITGNIGGGGLLANMINSGAVNFSASNNVVNTNSGFGIQLLPNNSPITGNFNIDGNTVQNNTLTGISTIFNKLALNGITSLSNNTVSGNKLGGINFQINNPLPIPGTMTSLTLNGNLVTNNTNGDGLQLTLTNAPVNGTLSIQNGEYAGNGGNGINFNVDGGGFKAITMSGNNQGAGNLQGISNNTLAGLVFNITNSSLAGGAINLDNNVVSSNQGGGGVLATLSGVDPKSFSASKNTIISNKGTGINFIDDTPVAGNINLDNNTVNTNTQGIITTLTNSGAANFSATGNTLNGNTGMGIQLTEVNSPITGKLNIDSNSLVGNLGTGISFTTDKPVNGPASISNNSVLNGTGGGISYVENNAAGNLVATSVLNFNTNLVSGNTGGDGLSVQLANSPITQLNIFSGQYASNSGHGVNLDLMKSSLGSLSISANKAALPGTNAGISKNTLDGIRINQNASNIGSLVMDNDAISNNTMNGIEMLVGGLAGTSNLPSLNTPITISNSTISNNGIDGFRLLNPVTTNVAAFGLNFLTNNISNNTGTGIDLSLDGKAGTLNSVFTGNTISNNGSFGLRLDASKTAQYVFDVGVAGRAANTFNANSSAGVGITMANTTQGVLSVDTNTISGTKAGPAGNFSGVGVDVQLVDSSKLSYFAVQNSTIGGAAGNGNAGGGISLLTNGTASVYTPVVNNNSIQNNGGDGVFFNRQGNSKIAATNPQFPAVIGASITKNTISNNSGNGIDIIGANAKLVDTYTITNNQVNSNKLNGLKLDARFDSQLATTVNNNSFSSNTLDGIRLTTVNNSPGDARSVDGNWANNTISNNTGNGVDITGVHGANTGLTLNNNTVTGNSLDGVFDGNSGGLSLQQNTVNANKGNAGLELVGSDAITTNSNKIYANTGAGVIYTGFNTLSMSGDTIGLPNGLGNGGDGVQINVSSSILNGTAVTMDKMTITDNTGRGVNILNSDSSGLTTFSLNVGLTNSNILRNGHEGVLAMNTAANNQNINADSTIAPSAKGSVTNDAPYLNLHVTGNTVNDNGKLTNFVGTGIVVRVGTAQGQQNAPTDDGGFASMNGNASRAGVIANISNNSLTGNAGADVHIDSFTSTAPPTSGTIWNYAPPGTVNGAGNYQYNANGYQSTPLARLDLTWAGNTGDELHVTNSTASGNGSLAAFYQTNDAQFASRGNRINDNFGAPNANIVPGGTFTTDGPFQNTNRQINATRQAFRGTGVNELAPGNGSPDGGQTGANGGANAFLYPGMGASTFRIHDPSGANLNGDKTGFPVVDNSGFITDNPSAAANYTSIGNANGIVNPGAGQDAMPYGWGTF